jgi:hypothetical protein
MGDICNLSPERLREVIRESNSQSAKGSQKYVIWENHAILNDYEFIAWGKRGGRP